MTALCDPTAVGLSSKLGYTPSVARTIGGFELLGTDDDETRMLVHRASGYAVAMPGHPRASAAHLDSPASDIVITLTDKPVELAYRLDTMPASLEPEALAVSLALAYGSARIAATPGLQPEVKPLRGK